MVFPSVEDANGRDESGLLHGDVVWEGDYELCKKVKGRETDQRSVFPPNGRERNIQSKFI